MANRRISRNKNFASYVNSINQDVSALKNQNAGGSISAGAISGDSLSETVTLFSSSIQSNNYSAGAAGWKIDGSGVAEFADVYVRGDINAQTGTIGYWNISPVDATRYIGPTKIFGTFLESSDIGINDEEKTSGVYVSLFKSYFEDPKPLTNRRRINDEATITVPGHSIEVGDYVVVVVNEDSTFSTEADGALVVEVSADTITYERAGSDFPIADPTSGITPSTLSTGTAQYYQKDRAGIFIKDYGKILLDYGYFSSDGVKYSSGSSLNAILNPSFEYLSDSTQMQTYSNGSWTSGGSAPSGGSIGSYDFGASPVIYDVSSTYGLGYKWTTTSFSNVATNYLQGTIDYASARDYHLLHEGDSDAYFTLSGHYQAELSNKFTVNALAVSNSTTITITPANITSAITAATLSGGVITYTVNNHGFFPGNIVTVSGFSNTTYNITNGEITSTSTNTFNITKAGTTGSAGGTLGSVTGIPMTTGDIVYLDFISRDTNGVDFTSDAEGNRFYKILTTTTTTFTITNLRAIAATGAIVTSTRTNDDGTTRPVGLYKLFSGRAITGATVPLTTADITVTIPYHGLSANDHIVLDAAALDDNGYDWFYPGYPPVKIVKSVVDANTIAIHNPQYIGVDAPSNTPVIESLRNASGFARPAAVYKVPSFRWNANDISFVFSNGNTASLSTVLSSAYKTSDWSIDTIGASSSYFVNQPESYLADALDLSSGVSSLVSATYQIDSTLFDRQYSTLDASGYANNTSVYVRVPVVLEKTYLKDTTVSATANTTSIVYTIPSHPFSANDIVNIGGFLESSTTEDKFNLNSVKITSVTTNTIIVPNSTGASGSSTTLGYVYGYPSINKTYVTSNNTNKNVGFIFDNFSISKKPTFFYGGSSYPDEFWLDESLAPNVASINTPGDWINIDLETQSNYLSNVTELMFAPYTSQKMFSSPSISPIFSGGYVTTPSLISDSLGDESALQITSGLLNKNTELGLIETSAAITPITSVAGSGVEMTAYTNLTATGGGSYVSSTASIGVWSDSSYKSYMNVVADSVSFVDANFRPVLQSGVLIQNSGSTANGYARSMYVTSGTNVTTSSTSYIEASPSGYFETGPSGAALIWYTMRADNTTSAITRGSFRIRYGLDSSGNEVTNGAIVVDFSSTGRSLSMQGTNETTSTNFYQFIGKPFTVYRIVFGQTVSGGTGGYYDKTLAVTPII